MTRPRRTAPPPTDGTAAFAEHRPVPGELVFLGVVLVLTLFFSLAGVPGEAERVAGDGSPALRRAWLEERAGEQADDAATAPPERADHPARAAAPDAGRR